MELVWSFRSHIYPHLLTHRNLTSSVCTASPLPRVASRGPSGAPPVPPSRAVPGPRWESKGTEGPLSPCQRPQRPRGKEWVLGWRVFAASARIQCGAVARSEGNTSGKFWFIEARLTPWVAGTCPVPASARHARSRAPWGARSWPL